MASLLALTCNDGSTATQRVLEGVSVRCVAADGRAGTMTGKSGQRSPMTVVGRTCSYVMRPIMLSGGSRARVLPAERWVAVVGCCA